MPRFPERLNYWHNNVLPLTASMLADDSTTIVCDGSNLKWVMPLGLCGLAAACHTLHERGQSIRFDGLTSNMQNYFERMDVFEHCHIDHRKCNRRADHADSLVELRCLSAVSEISSVATSIVKAITGQMMVGRDDTEDPEGMTIRPSERLSLNLHYVFSELLENALTHSQAHGYSGACVWVAANYFARSGTVRIGVVDTGCGFLKSLKSNERVRERPTDGRAIETALEPFVSCNKAVGIMSDSSNQGIGLTVSAQIAAAAGGWIEVNSGSASVKASSPRRSAESHLSWQGAALDVVMSREQLLTLDLRQIIRPYQRVPKPRLRFE
jgi:C4-dicarboxylate-specific signal transduction histidine kinase